MGNIIIEFFVAIIIFLVGYRMGYIACFKYLEGELKKRQNEQNYSYSMGTNQKVG